VLDDLPDDFKIQTKVGREQFGFAVRQSASRKFVCERA
jgi:hypothetical protein